MAKSNTGGTSITLTLDVDEIEIVADALGKKAFADKTYTEAAYEDRTDKRPTFGQLADMMAKLRRTIELADLTKKGAEVLRDQITRYEEHMCSVDTQIMPGDKISSTKVVVNRHGILVAPTAPMPKKVLKRKQDC